MSATFVVSKKNSTSKQLWMPNSIIFIQTMKLVSHQLKAFDKQIAKQVADAGDSDLSYFDISVVSLDSVGRIISKRVSKRYDPISISW